LAYAELFSKRSSLLSWGASYVYAKSNRAASIFYLCP
jgi:hypothetical protein